MNKLYYGDCLTIMGTMQPGSVDLVYLDPPFNSNRSYNAICKDETGRPLPDRTEAFCDIWELDAEREDAIRDMPALMRRNGIDDDTAQFWKIWCNALRKTNPRLLAYLSYMVQRLLPMRRLLKPTGSVYLHCDPTASHYIKIMMDSIFGHKNFRNEIIWCYSGGGSSRLNFARKHDVLLCYGVSKDTFFNADSVRVPYKCDVSNRKSDKAWGAHNNKVYAPDPNGKIPEDWWTDVSPLNSQARERMGYPTQKPLALLERIIKASCPENGVVLDPFCGSATTLEAAHRLKRKWIGIDIAVHAIRRVAKVRLRDRLGLVEGRDFEITGVPRTPEGSGNPGRIFKR